MLFGIIILVSYSGVSLEVMNIFVVFLIECEILSVDNLFYFEFFSDMIGMVLIMVIFKFGIDIKFV